MDADQLRELATNALTGHWPAHLGAKSDQEKIEYLARQLEAVANSSDEVEAELQADVDRLEAASVDDANEITRLKEIIDKASVELERA